MSDKPIVNNKTNNEEKLDDDYYCPRCGSCGESLCCPPERCDRIMSIVSNDENRDTSECLWFDEYVRTLFTDNKNMSLDYEEFVKIIENIYNMTDDYRVRYYISQQFKRLFWSSKGDLDE